MMMSEMAIVLVAALKVFSITDFGAVDSDSLQTTAIQAAIDAAAKEGGEVIVPTGTYRSGAIRLRSNVTLHLLEGAILEGSRNSDDYVVEGATRKRWFNAFIYGEGVENVSIIGEKYSKIDGMNCYDAQGEEKYRGPHCISFFDSTNLVFRGYEIRNSANWAHTINRCRGVTVEGVKIFGGHDGLDIHCCDRVEINHCEFRSGDDGIAGFGNTNVHVADCLFAVSCNVIRFGGTDCVFERCRSAAVSPFGHRYRLNDDDKRMAVNHGETIRHGACAAFAYYCDQRWGEIPPPGNIVIKDSVFEKCSNVVMCPYGEGGAWCKFRPLESLTFENCEFREVDYSAVVFGDKGKPIEFTMKNCRVCAAKTGAKVPVFRARDAKLKLENTIFNGYETPTVERMGELELSVQGGTQLKAD